MTLAAVIKLTEQVFKLAQQALFERAAAETRAAEALAEYERTLMLAEQVDFLRAAAETRAAETLAEIERAAAEKRAAKINVTAYVPDKTLDEFERLAEQVAAETQRLFTDAAMLCAPPLPMCETALLSAPPASTQPDSLSALPAAIVSTQPADAPLPPSELTLPQPCVEPLPLCAPFTPHAALCQATGNLSTCDEPMPLSAPSTAEPTCDEPKPMCAPSTDEPMPLSAPSIAEPTCDEPTPMCAPSTVEQKCGACRPKRGVRGGRRGHRARYLQSYC